MLYLKLRATVIVQKMVHYLQHFSIRDNLCLTFSTRVILLPDSEYWCYIVVLSPDIASSPGHSQILSRSRGEKSGVASSPGHSQTFLHGCEIKSGSGLGTRLPRICLKRLIPDLYVVASIKITPDSKSAIQNTPKYDLLVRFTRLSTYNSLLNFGAIA